MQTKSIAELRLPSAACRQARRGRRGQGRRQGPACRLRFQAPTERTLKHEASAWKQRLLGLNLSESKVGTGNGLPW